jgi:hypothetical protein
MVCGSNSTRPLARISSIWAQERKLPWPRTGGVEEEGDGEVEAAEDGEHLGVDRVVAVIGGEHDGAGRDGAAVEQGTQRQDGYAGRRDRLHLASEQRGGDDGGGARGGRVEAVVDEHGDLPGLGGGGADQRQGEQEDMAEQAHAGDPGGGRRRGIG